MPDARLIRIPDLAHDEQNALDELVQQWRSKRKRNAIRAGFYDMKNAHRHLMMSDAPLSVRRRSFVLGWSALGVDKLGRRCNLESFYDAGGVDLDSLGASEIMRDNRLTSEVNQAGIAGLIHATSFIVTTQGDTQSDEPDVIMSGRDALTSTGMWDVRRKAIRSFLSIHELDDKGEPVDFTLYLPNLNVSCTKSGGKWVVTRSTHVYGVPVDPLVYKRRLGRPFGSSRITRAAMALHEQALAAMIRADVNGEAYSLPRYVLLGATESAFQNSDGTPKPSWMAAWDAIWAIGDDEDMLTHEGGAQLARADVKQFTGQSPEPQNAHLRMLAQLFSGEMSIPIGELGIVGDSNPTSSEALEASRDDIIATAEQTTDEWTPDLGRAFTRALAMKNGNELPDLDVMPKWRNPRHVSRAAAADAGSKILDKMPWLADTEVGMELVGLSPDQIRRAQSERVRSEGRALLSQIVEQQAATDDSAG